MRGTRMFALVYGPPMERMVPTQTSWYPTYYNTGSPSTSPTNNYANTAPPIITDLKPMRKKNPKKEKRSNKENCCLRAWYLLICCFLLALLLAVILAIVLPLTLNQATALSTATTTVITTTVTTATTTTSTTTSTTATTSTTTTATAMPSCTNPTSVGQLASFDSATAPTNYTLYNYSFIANNSVTTLSFALNGDNGPTHSYWLLDTISVIDASTSAANLIVNGGFETGDFTGWTQYCATSANCDGTGGFLGIVMRPARAIGVDYGQITTSPCQSGSFCYVDKCAFAFDYLAQSFNTIVGDSYVVSFYLRIYATGSGHSVNVILS